MGARDQLRRAAVPTVVLDLRMKRVLRCLAVLAFEAGYLSSVPSGSLTYAAREWGVSTEAQTRALAIMRVDIVISLALVHLADRVGRRGVIMLVAVAAPALTVVSGLSTSLGSYTAIQIVNRGLVMTIGSLVGVMIVEETPALARAWASGLMVVAAAVGGGVGLGLVAIADSGRQVWRALFLGAASFFVVVPWLHRHLPESGRFLRHQQRPTPQSSTWRRFSSVEHRRRIVLVGALFALMAFESTPTRQLQSDFLRTERGYSSVAVATFSVLSNAPGILGLVVGAAVGDRFRRKRILTFSLIGFAVFDAALFIAHGSWIWIWSVIGAVTGAAALPILAILTTELFPTSIRSMANGLTGLTARIGGALGLLWVGRATHWFSRGTAIATSCAALVVAITLLAWIPETSGKEIEELNDEDAVDALLARPT